MEQSNLNEIGIVLAETEDFRAGGVLVSPARCEVRAGDQAFRLQPRVMQVLVLLCSRKGQVTTKEDLILHCWDGTAVTDDSITRVISQLRKLSKDLGGEAFSIRTIPKVGYALDAGDADSEDGDVLGVVSNHPARDAPRSTWRTAGLAIPLMIATLAFLWWQFGTQDDWTIGELQSLNLEGDIQSHPAVSPDGEYIVYSSSKDGGNRDLWMTRASGGVSTRLTTHPDIDHQATFSPSGDKLVFVRSTFDDPNTPCRIIVKDLSDLSETIVSRCKSASFRISTPAWSPDEKSLYLSEAVTAEPDSVLRLVQLDLETGERTPLTEPQEGLRGDYDPLISPDGTRLLFRRATDFRSGQYYLLNLEDSSLVALTEEGFFSAAYTWTPDGQQFFLISPDAGAGLSVFDFNGELIEQKPSGLLYPLGRMSRGGNLLAAEVNIQSSVVVEERDGQSTEISDARTRQRMPTLSPQGVLAYVTTAGEEAVIWLVEEGAAPRRFVDLPKINTLAWSPDGRELAYATAAGDQIGIVNVIDEKQRQMPMDRSAIGSLTWAPDGRSLIFGAQRNDQWQLWQVRSDFASRAQPWSDEGWWAVRSNSNAVFATRADQPGIWRMSPGGEPIEQVESTFAAGQNIGRTIEARNGFAVTDTQIYFHRNGADVGENGAIMVRPIEPGGSAVRLIELDEIFTEFDVGQDGRIVQVKQARDNYIVTLRMDRE